MNDSQAAFIANKKLTLEEIGGYFNPTRSAFRLEILQSFLVDDEVEPLKRFSQGEVDPPHDFNAGWRSAIRTAVARGVTHSRVRLVQEPLTPYLRFEIAWGYHLNVAAGEQVRIIRYDREPTFETTVPILKDFWLFDDTRCLLMEYDVLGRFLGASLVRPEDVPRYVDLKAEALARSADIREMPYWLSR